MFKRLKQNFPLKYFLGDNQNAIEIQILVSLIIQLIMLIIHRKVQRSWAYSNIMSVIGYHLMIQIDLFKLLKNPDSKWEEITIKNIGQLRLFDPVGGNGANLMKKQYFSILKLNIHDIKLNRSLAISAKIQECKMGNILGGLEKEFPIMSIDEFGTIDGKTRNRVTPGNALLTMLLIAIQEDKIL